MSTQLIARAQIQASPVRRRARAWLTKRKKPAYCSRAYLGDSEEESDDDLEEDWEDRDTE